MAKRALNKDFWDGAQSAIGLNPKRAVDDFVLPAEDFVRVGEDIDKAIVTKLRDVLFDS